MRRVLLVVVASLALFGCGHAAPAAVDLSNSTVSSAKVLYDKLMATHKAECPEYHAVNNISSIGHGVTSWGVCGSGHGMVFATYDNHQDAFSGALKLCISGGSSNVGGNWNVFTQSEADAQRVRKAIGGSTGNCEIS